MLFDPSLIYGSGENSGAMLSNNKEVKYIFTACRIKSAAHISGLLLCRTILFDLLKNTLKNRDFLFYCLPNRPVLF